ncbi:OTU domain-containing protein [Aphis craccivora]|uniref:OTU domain-containing protein n=1 Tax=Aphis craccivora TaxID=307492 RepID=A0A6G0ZIN8_APHCR|nr:OTU domain-containing protein [Aphis craccivora]
MTLELLNVNGEMVPHIVVGDVACLFNSLFYLMYGTEQMAREVRKHIVSHATKNWMEYGDNYMSSAEYLADMSQL